MTTGFTDSLYFSGQGVLMLASKDATTGEPLGFTPVGNVSDLKLGVSTNDFTHKESQSGARGVDLTLTTETACTASMIFESLNKENLALCLYGTSAETTGASVVDEALFFRAGKWVSLANISVSNITNFVADPGGTPVPLVLGENYDINLDAGSIYCYTTAEQTAASATNTITDGQDLNIDYDFATQASVEALTNGAAPIRWARFEGLNTADADKPVVVDIYKLATKPLAELALIQDEIAQMSIEANGLSDSTRSTGSKFFTYRYLV